MTRFERLVAEVRRIHTRERAGGHASNSGAYQACGECFRDWPCETIQALTNAMHAADESGCLVGL